MMLMVGSWSYENWVLTWFLAGQIDGHPISYVSNQWISSARDTTSTTRP